MKIMNSRVAEILELSVAERLEIVEDIWDSIVDDSTPYLGRAASRTG